MDNRSYISHLDLTGRYRAKELQEGGQQWWCEGRVKPPPSTNSYLQYKRCTQNDAGTSQQDAQEQRLTFRHSQHVAAWNRVTCAEAARAPHDMPTVFGRPELEVHGGGPWAQASALDFEGVTSVILHDEPGTRLVGHASRYSGENSADDK